MSPTPISTAVAAAPSPRLLVPRRPHQQLLSTRHRNLTTVTNTKRGLNPIAQTAQTLALLVEPPDRRKGHFRVFASC